MCGIAGLALSERTAIPNREAFLRATVQEMTGTLRHRGPDAHGLFADESVGLGHTRLSILDLSPTGAQPMMARPGGTVIVYNGECYNFPELRYELEATGVRFRGRSDTEVILQVYETWGMNGLKRLEGIFAFALWDPAERLTVLMRDRLGVKPLFYGESSHGVAFGSEIKAVLVPEGIDTDLDDQALAEYMWFGNAHEDRTFYKGVRALEPGHWLIIKNGVRRMEAWWRLEDWLHPAGPDTGEHGKARELANVLDSAVRRQMVADVPVAVFLSGGVDSSSIAASAVRGQSKPLASFAAGFDYEQGVNELPKAGRVADLLGLDHHELRIEGGSLPEAIQVLAEAHDEPFADAANIPLYLMCRQISSKTKVVLQGDGGDEVFGGYRRYALAGLGSFGRGAPQGMVTAMRRFGARGLRLSRVAAAVSNPDDGLRIGLLVSAQTLAAPPEVHFEASMRDHLSNTTDPFLVYRRAAERFSAQDPLAQMMLTDMAVLLPSTYLNKVDRATMAVGVEARVPLLDDRVVRFALNLPSMLKVRGRHKKVLLRASQRGRLPDTILDGAKTGFGVPFGHWMRHSLHDFTRERILDAGFLRGLALDGHLAEQALDAHRDGGADHGDLLWKLLQLSIWSEKR
jgi:asparagine synthase (glutamine-hydrolysing)